MGGEGFGSVPSEAVATGGAVREESGTAGERERGAVRG